MHLPSEELSRHLIGRRYDGIVRAVERRGGADQLILYMVSGPTAGLAIQQGWSDRPARRYVRDSDGQRRDARLALGGAPAAARTTMVGVLILDGAVSVEQPMTLVFDRGDARSERFRWTTPARGRSRPSAELAPRMMAADSGGRAGSADAVTDAAGLANTPSSTVLPGAECPSRRCVTPDVLQLDAPYIPLEEESPLDRLVDSDIMVACRVDRHGARSRFDRVLHQDLGLPLDLARRLPRVSSGSWTAASSPSRTSPAAIKVGPVGLPERPAAAAVGRVHGGDDAALGARVLRLPLPVRRAAGLHGAGRPQAVPA